MSQHLDYFAKQPSPQREICEKLHQIIKNILPEATESMLWGVPVFNDGLVYLVALKDHVNLGFTVANLTSEEEKLFAGGGKTTRKIEIQVVDEIDEAKIAKIIAFVVKKATQNF